MTVAPPITIGMPVFNGEPYLAAALESILAQTFTEFLLVVSDNGSTDATQEVVLSFANGDERVHYLRHPDNRGAAWNFNRVFEECRSPLFKYAASDDMLAPTCLERSVEMLQSAPPRTVVLVAPQTRWIRADGAFLRDGDDRMEIRDSTPHARLRHVVANVVWGNTTFGLIVSEALRRTRGTGSFPSADYVLLAELALLGQFWLVPEPLFLRREHDTMSRRANATSFEVARWLDPHNTRPENEFRRVFIEYVRGIEHSPLSPAEKARCTAVMVAAFMRRHANLRRRVALKARAFR